MRFANRFEAGRELAALLVDYADEDPIVLALPRGGVPVAAEVARRLHAPLDVFVARKLGAPLQPELAVGAIAEGGARYVDRGLCRRLGVEPDDLEIIAGAEAHEIERRVAEYRGGRPGPAVAGRTVILVDDGLATGATARAALTALRARGPRRLVLAVPVAAAPTAALLRELADDVVAVQEPDDLWAIGYWYADFRQVDDAEVHRLLGEAAAAGAPADERPHAVIVAAGEVRLDGDLGLPPSPHGLVLFAHGSGSSRFSPRNRAVARQLRQAGFATLLVDLLTPAEARLDEATGELRFDIALLARRLDAASDWVRAQPSLVALPLGYFGASTGAAAALVAAAGRGDVAAVVSRGGRPDLAGAALGHVPAPTLLIVGARDYPVVELNQQALEALRCDRELVLVPGATTHLFEEPGALERVAELAAGWFARYLSAAAHATA